MSTPSKAEVLVALERLLSDELEALAAQTSAARDEATHAESRPENQYDTRALEASYLAAGQGERLGEVRRLWAWISQQTADPACERAVEGALVGVSIGGAERWVLLAPRGGPEVRVGAARVVVQLVSTDSPLGRAVFGLREGDGAELDTPRGPRELEVVAVG